MPVDIVTIPCLSDNYAYLLKGPDGVVLIDAPEAAPIRQALAVRGWGLDTILITHHHHDHVGAIAALKAEFGATVIGPRAEASKIDGLDQLVAGGDQGGSGAGAWQVLDVPGHTLGHVAFHFPGAHAVFTADSLMALGCGRIFEGTPPMMYDSLCALAALPPETMVYSGHEYTQANARFAATIEPDNPALQARIARITAARVRNMPTVPSLLSEELATNPFLRADQPDLQAALGMAGAPAADVFAHVRALKDKF